ncbi:MAG: DUF1848 domain-containing protein [Dehalococcoidia bacterium]|nr:DUF1848 domain-containing protein [Dehalococcoidia bacterium]
MIISASRRTDIPALYSEWFINRVRAGWCAVPNPVNSRQVSRVSLDPRDVDAIVFWSKNPAPMLPHLDELDGRGFRYYFQFSLNDYPAQLEPSIPCLVDRTKTFLSLSSCIGPPRVIWRYDPIIISNVTPGQYHSDRFARIAKELRGATHRVMVSIVDFYRKTDRRLSELEWEGFAFDRQGASSAGMVTLLKDLATIASRHDMEIFTCAEGHDLSETGILPGRCIDECLLSSLWALNLGYTKDPAQRDLCLCTVSKDIGMNNTCIHGCPYCYATGDQALARRRYEEHDPRSPSIWRDGKTPHGLESETYGRSRR